MKTTHRILLEDARKMRRLKDESIDLMITSPPYPMIKMWDAMFYEQNPEIAKAIKNEDGERAFELMHKELDSVWKETYRVLKIGGVACINIGDATRSIGGRFQIYPNHSRVLSFCLNTGFHALPEILWVKETNKPDKFMGSGMLPVGAYVTLEHEHILILRKAGKREFERPEEKANRQKSAFFWEERNVWFSDKWSDINGVFQRLNHKKLRDRSAAYPIELAYRLINMFSVHGDTVLDPYLGTGTTTLAAIASARNSVGYEIDLNFKCLIEERIREVKDVANEITKQRLTAHLEFVKTRFSGGESKYRNENYKFPVMTNQETRLIIPKLRNVAMVEEGVFEARHVY
ncbi:MAG: DNA-methyltransferase [Candidatus Aenigmatarchaeota archaeon]